LFYIIVTRVGSCCIKTIMTDLQKCILTKYRDIADRFGIQMKTTRTD